MNRKSTTRKSMHGGSNNNSMETTVVGDCYRKLDELEEQAREVKSTCQREVDELKEKANGNRNSGFNPQKAISKSDLININIKNHSYLVIFEKKN